MAAKFKVGDLVKLKSGGPVMTVVESSGHLERPDYLCTWFAGRKNESATFPHDAVEPANGE